MLADAAAAPATGSAGTTATGQQQGSALGFVIPMGLMLVILYFMMIRPQSQRAKKLAKLVDSFKAGDRVVTASGIVGVVVSVKDRTVSIRSADAKMEMTKSSVVQILERDGDEKSAS